MAKRFTDTEIWNEDWFLNGTSEQREFWRYCSDKCDFSGIFRPNFEGFKRLTGQRIDPVKFLGWINTEKERIVILPNNRWWLTGFIGFQYGNTLNPASTVHKGIIKQLQNNQVLDIIETYGLSLLKPIESLKDKDKDKDKDIP